MCPGLLVHVGVCATATAAAGAGDRCCCCCWRGSGFGTGGAQASSHTMVLCTPAASAARDGCSSCQASSLLPACAHDATPHENSQGQSKGTAQPAGTASQAIVWSCFAHCADCFRTQGSGTSSSHTHNHTYLKCHVDLCCQCQCRLVLQHRLAAAEDWPRALHWVAGVAHCTTLNSNKPEQKAKGKGVREGGAGQVHRQRPTATTDAERSSM